MTSEEYNIMRCHREIEKQNSQDGVYISGVFEYTYQDSEGNGEPSETEQQINEESTQNSEENEETFDVGDDEIPDFENEPKGTK